MLNPYKLAADLVAPISERLLRGTATIFVLHRFADRDRGNQGHDPTILRADLEYLRRQRYELVSLVDLAARLRDRDPHLGKTVAFTVDDGYADFASVGARIFADYECPVTCFVVTGVLDQGGWYWWDRLQETIGQSRQPTLAIDVARQPFIAALGTPELARQAARLLIERLKRVSDADRLQAIEDTERFLGVELPVWAPPEFAPMTWAEVRRCAEHGVTYGPHTVTHPIMSRLDDASARQELEGSLSRLREQTTAAVAIFCYPNGGPGDISPREPANLQLLGFESAVTSCVGYATASEWHSTPESPFLLPRFGYNGNPALFKQIVTGVLRARLAIRRGPGIEQALSSACR